jgi:hypothetical protein
MGCPPAERDVDHPLILINQGTMPCVRLALRGSGIVSQHCTLSAPSAAVACPEKGQNRLCPLIPGELSYCRVECLHAADLVRMWPCLGTSGYK